MLGRLDDPRQPIAETCRRAGAAADALGVPRASYEQLRLLVHEERARTKRRQEKLALLLDVELRARPPEALLDLVD